MTVLQASGAQTASIYALVADALDGALAIAAAETRAHPATLAPVIAVVMARSMAADAPGATAALLRALADQVEARHIPDRLAAAEGRAHAAACDYTLHMAAKLGHTVCRA